MNQAKGSLVIVFPKLYEVVPVTPGDRPQAGAWCEISYLRRKLSQFSMISSADPVYNLKLCMIQGNQIKCRSKSCYLSSSSATFSFKCRTVVYQYYTRQIGSLQ